MLAPMHVRELDQFFGIDDLDAVQILGFGAGVFGARRIDVHHLRFQVAQHLVGCGGYSAWYFANTPAACKVFTYQSVDAFPMFIHLELPNGSPLKNALVGFGRDSELTFRRTLARDLLLSMGPRHVAGAGLNTQCWITHTARQGCVPLCDKYGHGSGDNRGPETECFKDVLRRAGIVEYGARRVGRNVRFNNRRQFPVQ